MTTLLKKRMTIMIVALGIIFGGIIGFNVFKKIMIKRFFAHYEAPPVAVSTVKAIKKNWQPHLQAVGNFVAVNGVEVNSEASGSVVKIHFDSGQYITKDQPLIDIDDSIDQALLKFNQADMALKKISYQRQLDLLKRGATSSSSVDEAKANLQQAEANVEKIIAQIRQKHLLAPFSGRLGIRQVNLGQYITPGQTSVVTLQSLDPLYLEFNLPEQMYNLLHINQSITFSVEEFPNMLFKGKINAINSKVDPSTHNILVQATLPNCPALPLNELSQSPLIDVKQDADSNKKIVLCHSDKNSENKINQFLFIPGMFTAIAIELPAIKDVIVLPSTAISYSLYGNSVFIVEDNKKNKKNAEGKPIYQVKRAFITTGEQEGNYTIIKTGVKAGQQVVSSGELKLQNGANVVINNSIPLKDNDPATLSQ